MSLKTYLLTTLITLTLSIHTTTTFPRPDLTDLFTPKSKWTWLGGDSSTSIPLPNYQTLWLFGDTLRGKLIRHNTQRQINSMPHSSVAKISKQSATPTFYFPSTTRGFFTPPLATAPKTSYYWLIDGIIGKDTTHLFIQAMVINGTPEGFEQLGTDLIIVSNPTASPALWQSKSIHLPHTNNTLTFNEGIGQLNGYIYLMGKCNATSACLSRAIEKDLIHSNEEISTNVEYYTGSKDDQGWSSDISKISSLFEHTFTEGTLKYNNILGWHVFLCQAYDSYIHVAYTNSPSIEGPWKIMKNVYEIPIRDRSNGTFSYAAKSHPELVNGGNGNGSRFIVSYNTNAGPGLNALINRTWAYHPNFIEIDVVTQENKEEEQEKQEEAEDKDKEKKELVVSESDASPFSLTFSPPVQLPWGCPGNKCKYGGSTAADSFVSYSGINSNVIIGTVHNTNTSTIVVQSNNNGKNWKKAKNGGLGPGLSYLINNDSRTTIGNAVIDSSLPNMAVGTETSTYTISNNHVLQHLIIPTNITWNFPKSIQNTALPPVCLFSGYSGKIISIHNTTWLKTIIIKRNCTNPPSTNVKSVKSNTLAPEWGTLGNADIWLFESIDQKNWNYKSVVATHQQTRKLGYEEGANENDIVMLNDQTLLVIFRADGGDGWPNHSRKSFLKVVSKDMGMTWSTPVVVSGSTEGSSNYEKDSNEMATDFVGSARPMLLMMQNGVLLLSGGRPYLNVWASMKGDGTNWISYNVAQEHNVGVTALNSTMWKFCNGFANGTSTWQGSTCYTSLMNVDDGALICYDNLGTASPVAPIECRTDPVLYFCMRIE